MKIYIDGGGKDSVMKGRYGYVIVKEEGIDYYEIKKFWKDDKITDNEVIYKAIIKLFEKMLPRTTATILCSDRMIINQIQGRWIIRQAKLKNLLAIANAISEIKQLNIKVEFIIRSQNRATQRILELNKNESV